MRELAIFLMLGALCGCANTNAYIATQAEHASHISQHFETPSTNYGYDSLAVSFRIEQQDSGAFAEISEGYILEKRWSFGGITGAGAMLGPSELTQITVGYRWRVW
jgi:hypothetical protein